ncbi:MAG: DUF4144 domain-containing protein [Gammaproteobacteria bacterium]|nr:DUF4144 domain-containing protein [Gammaproteobacteria bacterium]
MINWPAVIKHSDDAELIHVRDQVQWDDDADLHSFDYNEADCLIDSTGCVFDITNKEAGIVRPSASELVLELKSILGLVKAHAAQSGSCCVAKLYAPTIEDAYKIVESLN